MKKSIDRFRKGMQVRPILFFLLVLFSTSAFSQSTIIAGDTSLISTSAGTTVVVDNSLTIVTTFPMNAANVSINSGKQTGDTLWYTGALPSGVTASYNAIKGTLTFIGSASFSQYQALLRTVTFKSLSASASATRSISFTLGSSIALNNHFYEYVASSNIRWTAAKDSATNRRLFGLKGYLATVTSASENAFIAAKLLADAWMGASDEYTHINTATGTTTYINQTGSEGKWYWVTGPEKGTQFSNGNAPGTTAVGGNYMNWNPVQPDNYQTLEHYGQFYSSSSPAGKWNDLALTDLLNGYICEYGGMAGETLT